MVTSIPHTNYYKTLYILYIFILITKLINLGYLIYKLDKSDYTSESQKKYAQTVCVSRLGGSQSLC